MVFVKPFNRGRLPASRPELGQIAILVAMGFPDLFDKRVPARIRLIAIERIYSNRSLEDRTDIDSKDRILALVALHDALPKFRLKAGELAMCQGISARTERRRRDAR